MKRTSIAALAVLLVVSAPALSGCFSGFEATTTTQSTMNSGNGVEAAVGSIDVENTTLVLGPEGSASATLLTRVFNTGAEDDTLTFVQINGVPAYVTPGASAVPAGNSASFGADSEAWINTYELDVPVSSYVPVELFFEKAGSIKLSVLTVPATGYYEGIAPNPAVAPLG